MTISILEPGVAAAVAAAASQEAQRTAFLAPWAGGDVTVRAMNGATLRETMTYGPWEPNSATPRGATLGVLKARTVTTTGAPTAFVFRAGSVDIFSIPAAVSPASADLVMPAALGGVSPLARTNLADGNVGKVTVSANPALPVTGAAATAFTLSLSQSSGVNGQAITVTVTPNGPVQSGGASALLSATNGGVLGVSSLSFTSGSVAAQSTTLTRAAAGTSVVTMTNTAGLLNTGSPASYTSAAAGAAVASFTLTAPTTATHPFTLGHAFRQGDIPAGSGIVVTGAAAQAIIKNAWPDGSAKFAVIAGTASLTASTPAAVSLSAGTASTGTALTTADLVATGITAAVDAGAFGGASFGSTEWASPFQSWVSGHRMSSWVYRKQVGSDAHLVAWLEVRLYAGGAVEVLPWIENGYLTVAGPTNKSATYAFTLGGSQRFSAAIDLKHHQRTPLVSGAALSHWLGADQAVVPLHDAAYLQATELVPTYAGVVAANAAVVTALPATFTPLQQGSFNYSTDDMSSTGYQEPIGLLPQHDVLHLTAATAARQATYAAVVRNGYSAGRYALHARDETTNRPPLFSAYPTLVWASGGIKDSGASTTNTLTPASSGGATPLWDTSHGPSVGFMAYLLTGRFYFMEEVQFAATTIHFSVTDWARGGGVSGGVPAPGYTGASGIVSGFVQLRAGAWWMRSLAQALCVTPTTDPLHAEFKASVQNTVNFHHAKYVAQANNPFGFVQPDVDYGTTGIYRSSPWMQDFYTAAFGYTKAMGLPLDSTPASNLTAFFAWTAQSVVGRLGTSASPDWWYINAAPYTIAVAPSDTPNWTNGTGPWYANWRAMYDATAATEPNRGAVEGVLAGSGEAFPETTQPSTWHNLQPALAYAVRFGVTGAQAAYYRMTGATNWSSMQALWNTKPVWSAKPATGLLPAWLASAPVGQWVAIPNSNISAYTTPGGFAVSQFILDAYSGFFVDETTGELVFRGGGHNDYSGNEVIGLPLRQDSPGFRTICEPTPLVDRVPAAVWWGTVPNQKPNNAHTFDAGIHSAALGRYIWFGQSSPWNSSGAVSGGDRMFSMVASTGTWVQLADDLGQLPAGSGRTCTRDLAGNLYLAGGASVPRIFKYTPGSGWTTLANNSVLNWNSYGALVCDTSRNRLLRLGDGFISGLWFTIDCTSGAITDVAPLLNGAGSIVADLNALTVKDSPGALYDPHGDRYLIPTGNGASLYAINASTWAVTLLNPAAIVGAVPNASGYPTVGIWGRAKYVPTLRAAVYFPTGLSNGWAMRLA